MGFIKATKTKAKLRLALVGPSGAGKTYSALSVAQFFGKVAVIDTERGSASKYADIFNFDVMELETFAPAEYVKAIHEAERAGYDVLVIDSLSHAWMGKGGALEQVDNAAKRSNSGNNFAAWRDVTPQHNALVDAMVGCKLHLIVTMRSKTDYVMEEYVGRDGKTHSSPKKVGLAPIQRDGLEYEFDVVADMTLNNDMVVSKSRCSAMSGQVYNKPGRDVYEVMDGWLNSGAERKPEQERHEMTPDEAAAVTTKKGTRFGDLTREQLLQVLNSRATSDHEKNAASVLVTALDRQHAEVSDLEAGGMTNDND